MSDLISRQAAIDAINHICPVDTEYDCTLLDRVDVRCVLSDLPSAQPELEIVRCAECHFFETDHFEMVQGIPLIVAHDICMRWGDGCKTSKDGFCFMGERKEVEHG